MKGLRFFQAVFFALAFCSISVAQMQNVAVVETEVDPQAAVGLTAAEVRQITVELRREAVNNLLQDKYNVMTLETILALAGDNIEEWAEENRVVSLGSKIGANFIVRGIISKIQAKFTLSVEIYDTEDGKLVASLDPVRSENIEELLEKAATASAKMYAAFVNVQNPPQEMTDAEKKKVANAEKQRQRQKKSELDAEMKREIDAEKQRVALRQTELDANAKREAKAEKQSQKLKLAELDADTKRGVKLLRERQKESGVGGGRSRGQGEKRPHLKTGVSFGLGLSDSIGDPERNRIAGFAQIGFVHTRPILGNVVSLNVEGNFLFGESDMRFKDSAYTFYGNNVPVTFMLHLGSLALETGVRVDMRYGNNESLFDFGFVAGAVLGPIKKSAWRYFYRYGKGLKYDTHTAGVQYLF